MRALEPPRPCGRYLAAAPTYIGGFMTLGWSTDNAELRQVTTERLAEPLTAHQGCDRTTTPRGSTLASFALPVFVREIGGHARAD